MCGTTSTVDEKLNPLFFFTGYNTGNNNSLSSCATRRITNGKVHKDELNGVVHYMNAVKSSSSTARSFVRTCPSSSAPRASSCDLDSLSSSKHTTAPALQSHHRSPHQQDAYLRHYSSPTPPFMAVDAELDNPISDSKILSPSASTKTAKEDEDEYASADNVN